MLLAMLFSLSDSYIYHWLVLLCFGRILFISIWVVKRWLLWWPSSLEVSMLGLRMLTYWHTLIGWHWHTLVLVHWYTWTVQSLVLLLHCSLFTAFCPLFSVCLFYVPFARCVCVFYLTVSSLVSFLVMSSVETGNHEASNLLQSLYYGGWVAPNIYFLGFAGDVLCCDLHICGWYLSPLPCYVLYHHHWPFIYAVLLSTGVVWYGGIRIAGMSGIFDRKHYRWVGGSYVNYYFLCLSIFTPSTIRIFTYANIHMFLLF